MRNRKDGTLQGQSARREHHGLPARREDLRDALVKRQGDSIGALALIVIDNPMCAGTGHRICNDCMKGCIYQKTEPVDIPQIETSVLTDVLFMPYGFEIYSLLTRWNPLNVRRPYARAVSRHERARRGSRASGLHACALPAERRFRRRRDRRAEDRAPARRTSSATARTRRRPIEDFGKLYEDLDKRMLAGFGGVAEYGITVRWDKNFLKVIYLAARAPARASAATAACASAGR